MVTQKLLENAHKIAFLIRQYPEHKLPDILKLLGMPAIEINTALWYAQETGLIAKPGDDGTLEFLKEPENWNFGDTVDTLMDMIMFAFRELAKKEEDLEENYLSNWTLGYASHDVMVALATLTNTGQLTTYTLADPDDLQSVYVFYTLPENAEQVWGRKQFKKEPVQEKDMPKEGDTTQEDTPNEQ